MQLRAFSLERRLLAGIVQFDDDRAHQFRRPRSRSSPDDIAPTRANVCVPHRGPDRRPDEALRRVEKIPMISYTNILGGSIPALPVNGPGKRRAMVSAGAVSCAPWADRSGRRKPRRIASERTRTAASERTQYASRPFDPCARTNPDRPKSNRTQGPQSPWGLRVTRRRANPGQGRSRPDTALWYGDRGRAGVRRCGSTTSRS